ncbi:hypothetical protein EDP1_3705 [Pseudomonas putida S610]|nr:hypothetical protein EDP1_3705 [Pseudomonas putida S610]
MLVGQQGRQVAVRGQHALFYPSGGIDTQWQGVDEHAQRAVGALTCLRASHQHRAEHHIAAVGQHPKYTGPGHVHQARSTDPQAPGLGTQALGQAMVERQQDVLDASPVALHVGITERQRGLIDIGQQGLEEGLVGAFIAQASLGNVITVWHGRRQGMPLPEQQGAHLEQHHVQGRVVQSQVMEQQHGHHPVIVRVQAIVQLRQGCLAQVHAVMAGIEARLQLVDARGARILVQVGHLEDAQLGLAPHHLQRLRQAVTQDSGAQNVMSVDNLLQGPGPGQQALDAVECQACLQEVGVALLCAQVMVEHALLQRRQRIDFLHVGRAAGYLSSDAVDQVLLQRDQAEHVGRNALRARRHAIGRHLQGRAIADHSGQGGDGGLGEQHAHVHHQ